MTRSVMRITTSQPEIHPHMPITVAQPILIEAYLRVIPSGIVLFRVFVTIRFTTAVSCSVRLDTYPVVVSRSKSAMRCMSEEMEMNSSVPSMFSISLIVLTYTQLVCAHTTTQLLPSNPTYRIKSFTVSLNLSSFPSPSDMRTRIEAHP